jgi:RNA polymerase sigma-70 factor, ECF subfamily
VDPDRSFERIYRRHRREVYGSVLRDVCDPDEAEDVTQAAFLNAFRALRRGDQPEKPRAWLLTIARNVVRRRARLRAERPQEVELEADSELLLTLDDPEGSASDDIHAALRRLTDLQREVILLREIQGRSYAEIASELGLSLSAVEALIFRARRALAEELELVDRVPVVQPTRRHGLFALPGLAKLGSFGFSFGRVSVACMVGCAVVATVPIRDGSASDEPVPAAKAPQQVLVSDGLRHQERPLPVEVKKDKRRSSKDDKQAQETKPKHHSESSGSDGGTLSVELPPVELPPVELPPVELPPVDVPVPSVEVPPAPQLPGVPALPPLESLTS